MLNGPFSPWPSFSEEEVDAVASVIRSNRVNYWTGQECREFEKEFADWCGTSYAIALANGTVALDLALAGLKIGSHYGGSSQDEVIVTPRTFLASVSTVVSAGAVPVFADVEADSGNFNAETVGAVITPNTKAVIAVHLGGWPCDMDPIMALANKHNFKVIEDCAQAHGAMYKGRPVGSIGHLSAWSFCQDKIMTTGGEGGMVTTNDYALWSKMWSYKDHGKSWDAVYSRNHAPRFRWVHESFGTNWRMTEMQATIGRIQLKRIEEWTQKRAANAAIITNALLPFSKDGGAIRLPRYKCATCPGCDVQNSCRHAQYKYTTYIQPHALALGWNRGRILDEIVARGVPCFQGGCPEVYLEKAFDDTGWRPKERLPVARELGDTSLMFLVHPTLTSEEMDKTAEVITEVMKLATE